MPTIRHDGPRPVQTRPLAAALAATALALSLSGCVLGPDRPKPVVSLPQDWKAASERDAWPAPDWWRSFGSPTLDTFMAEAVQHNFDLAAAVARVRQADAQARIAGAPLLPSVNANAGISRGQQPVRTGSKTVSYLATQQNFGLSASYMLDFWGQNESNLKAAQASALATRFDRATVALTVEANVAATYFDILALSDRLRVARGNLDAAERISQVVNARAQAGIASALDVAQQDSVVALVRAQLPPLEQQLRQTTNTLATLVGTTPENIRPPEGSLDALDLPPVAAGLPSGLLARRPDVQRAEARLVAANANIQAARAAFLPSITLTAQGGYQSTSLETLLAPANLVYSAAASLTQAIFDNGQRRGQLELQQGAYDELLQGYHKAAIQSLVDVENALIAVRQTEERERFQADAVAKARRAYEISEAQLRAGTVDLVNVLNAQQTLFNAQDTLAQVRLTRFQAAVSLFQALGGGWQKSDVEAAPENRPAEGVVPFARPPAAKS